MLTIYSNNTVSINHSHIGSVAQEKTETAFYLPSGERIGFGKRIVLSAPEKAGWLQLETELAARGIK